MSASRSDRLVPNAACDVTSLPLSPEDYFVLSRVAGETTVGELVLASGLDPTTAENIVQRLIEMGALQVAAATPAPPTRPAAQPRPRASDDPAARARERQRRLVAQRLAGQRAAASATATAQARTASAPRVELDREPAVTEPAAGESVVSALTPVSADDPRLDASLGIAVDAQRVLLAYHDRLADLTPFDALAILPTDDERAIRSAYFKASRRLHPDAYYGRELGPFRKILGELFHRANVSYDALMDPAKRRAWLGAHAERQGSRGRGRVVVPKLNKPAEEAAKPVVVREKARHGSGAYTSQDDERQERHPTGSHAAAGDSEASGGMSGAAATLNRVMPTGGDDRINLDPARHGQNSVRGRLTGTFAAMPDDDEPPEPEGPSEEDLEQARVHAEKAARDVEAERWGRAANLYRRAAKLDPTNAEYRDKSRHCMLSAKRSRAERSLTKGHEKMSDGDTKGAMKAYSRAEEACPHPVVAAMIARGCVEREHDKAREYAKRAVEALDNPVEEVGELPDDDFCEVLLIVAGVFRDLGQKMSAELQVGRVLERVPGHPEAVELQNSLKVT